MDCVFAMQIGAERRAHLLAGVDSVIHIADVPSVQLLEQSAPQTATQQHFFSLLKSYLHQPRTISSIDADIEVRCIFVHFSTNSEKKLSMERRLFLSKRVLIG